MSRPKAGSRLRVVLTRVPASDAMRRLAEAYRLILEATQRRHEEGSEPEQPDAGEVTGEA